MPEVAAEPPVAQRRPHVVVPSDEPARELVLVKERRLLAQRREHGIGIREEGGIADVEPAQVAATIVIPPRAFCRSVMRTFWAGSSSACDTSSRIRTASASQKAPSLRKFAR